MNPDSESERRLPPERTFRRAPRSRMCDSLNVDYDRLASQFIRALRGGRPQAALSRRIRAASNVVHGWEAGSSFPTAARTFFLAERVGVEPRAALRRFYGREPDFLDACELSSRAGVAQLLTDLRGQASVVELAARTGRTRFAVARWLDGAAEPRLPDFLRLVEASTLRMVDLLAAFVDPAELPEVSGSWEKLQRSRRAAFDAPWSQAMLRLMETEAYRLLARHEDGWLAERLGLPREEEARSLELLAATGQVRFDDSKWQQDTAQTLDTRADAEATRRLAAWWLQVGTEKLLAAAPGRFAYNVCAVSNADLELLRQLQRSYFAKLRAIVAESRPVERVVLVNMQLCELDDFKPVQAERDGAKRKLPAKPSKVSAHPKRNRAGS